MSHEVVTLGEPMVLLRPGDQSPLAAVTELTLGMAGAESNTAIALSHLGHRVRFMSRVGNDPFGQRVRSVLTEEGVDVTDIQTDASAPTGIFFREWLPDGQRRGFYYRAGSAASRMTPDHLRPDMFAGARLLHVTGITPALSQSCACTVARAIEMAHAAGAWVSFDPNYRAALWDTAIARDVLLPLMQQAEILLLGHEDCQAILGLDEKEAILRHGRDLGAQVVVLKQAERGACAWDGTRSVSLPADLVDVPLDPVGAGDAFNAGFLSGWLRNKDLADALRLGIRCGAVAVTVAGDYLSRADSVPLISS